MSGWIRLHRQIKDHWIWQDPVKFQWWLDLLLSANYAPAKVLIGSKLIDCDRGQTIRSLTQWAQRWHTSKDSTRNFLTLLKNDGMINTENMVKTTRITICNYDSYNTDSHDSQTQAKRKTNASQTLPIHKQEELIITEEEQKEEISKRVGKVIFSPPTLSEVKDYFKEKGYTESSAIKAFNYYEAGNWKDSKGTPVKSWKQKMHGVWFKDENKVTINGKKPYYDSPA